MSSAARGIEAPLLRTGGVHRPRRTLRLTLFIPALMACDGTPSDPGEPIRAFTSVERQVSQASTRFGLELFADVSTASKEANVLVSPLSASMALGMTANGAEDATLQAMRDVLGFGNLAEDSVNAAYRGLIDQLRARDDRVEFRLANSIWYERTFSVESAFLDAARKSFDAEVRGLDFADPAAPATISRWAEDATGGRIKDLIRSISPLEVLLLVNAVYFKAPWTTPFEPASTVAGPFVRMDGTTVSAPMMHSDATRPWADDGVVQLVELLYADSAFSMVLAMPSDGSTIDALIASLSPERWQSWIEALRPGRLLLTAPKFRFSFGQRLDDALRAMGMAIAFEPLEADFGRITRARDDLYISRVEHKTFIDVHELGTEAAAATAVGVGITSLPPSLVFDRPFLFAIRERDSGTILFIGRVGDPLATQG
jgi:serine protease inhibitor